MSKIFEALQRSGSTSVEMGHTVLAADAGLRHQAEPVRHPDAETENVEAVEPVVLALSSAELSLAESRAMSVRLMASDPVLPFDSPSRRAVEQYRFIRTKILHHPTSPKVLAVTSAGPGDGKTVTSINIAGAISLKAGASVLLIDGDMRRPSVARMLGLPSTPGLTDVIGQTCSLDDALIKIEQFPNCMVLPSGTRTQNPPELLESARWRTLCDTIRQRFGMIVIDTPPVAALADYELLETVSDSVVMVVRPNHTNRAAFNKAITSISATKMMGVVVNDVQDWFLWSAQNGQMYVYYDVFEPSQDETAQSAAKPGR